MDEEKINPNRLPDSFKLPPGNGKKKPTIGESIITSRKMTPEEKKQERKDMAALATKVVSGPEDNDWLLLADVPSKGGLMVLGGVTGHRRMDFIRALKKISKQMTADLLESLGSDPAVIEKMRREASEDSLGFQSTKDLTDDEHGFLKDDK